MINNFNEFLIKHQLKISEIVEHSLTGKIEFIFTNQINETKLKEIQKELEEILAFPEPFFLICKSIPETFETLDSISENNSKEESKKYLSKEKDTQLSTDNDEKIIKDSTENLISEIPEPIFDELTPERETNDLFYNELNEFSDELFTEEIKESNDQLKEENLSNDEFSLDNWKEKQLEAEIKKRDALNNQHQKEESPILKPGSYIKGKVILKDPIPITDIDFSGETTEPDICIEGEIFKIETKETKNGWRYSLYITDFTSSILSQIFVNKKKEKLKNLIESNLKTGARVKVFGDYEFNEYQREKILQAKSIQLLEPKKRIDESEDKRIEFHLHSQYSTLDGISKVKDIIDFALASNYEAIAITDHGVLQAYPEFQRLTKGTNLKVLYGLEANIVNTQTKIFTGESQNSLKDEIVFFDLETTGISIYKDKVIEIAAVRYKDGKITETFQTMVNPGIPIPTKVTELTGITNSMAHKGKTEKEAFTEFLDFVGDSVLAAHNATFDIGFLKRYLEENHKTFNFSYLDTLPLARALVPEISRFNMNRLCSFFKIKNERAHRAQEDSEASVKVMGKLFERANEKGVKNLRDLNNLLDVTTMALKNNHINHATVYALNQDGLYDLYQLVSDSHLKYFNKYPRIPKEILSEYRDNLLIGSGCRKGELYEAILDDSPDEVLKEIAQFYDFLEVQPVQNYASLKTSSGKLSKDKLEQINQKIIQIGIDLDKPVIATSDAHFLHPQDNVYREIIKSATSSNAASNRAPLFFRTTQEMIDEFNYLDPETVEEIVIENPKKLLKKFDKVQPIPDGTFPPEIPGADEEIKELTFKRAQELYGSELPEFIQSRIDRELNSIINNGYAVLYLIAKRLVKHSEEDGFIVGSRGSVGSSFVAYLCGITEVNSLKAHYVCPECHYIEEVNESGLIGPDLPDKVCPNCGHILNKEGFDIPFETFLGFEGDKEPDIDLNFSGENQAEAHRYTEELFGEGKTFRAGTISTIQEATAFGYVKNFYDNKGIEIPKAEIERLKIGCTGIKRTTGQHPGGIMVVPKNKDIFEFTPIQYPADDIHSPNITTHFDYHSISGRLLKLDLLGHDDPTMLRKLEILTGVNPREIPLDDREVISLFTSVDSLNFKHDCEIKLGNFGIPEFGTSFVYQMIKDLKPKSFADLIRISGWSHGTDVWTGNAQELVRNNKKGDEIISTRDDIMLMLLAKGLKPIDSFTIMEDTRKGRLKPEEVEIMQKNNVEDWFIESCKKIQYLFPKAHAVAYVIMAFRIAWYKIHYPLAYYSCFFGIRSKEFDLKIIKDGMEAVSNEIDRINDLARYGKLSNKDSQSLTTLQLALEMYARGYSVQNIDLKKSHYNEFIIEGDTLIPPFNTISGMGDLAAESLYNAIHNESIISQEDLLSKSKITKTNLATLEELGCLGDLPKSNQVSFF